MTSLLEAAGAQPRNPGRGKPIHVARMETGLFTNRSALHDPAQFVVSKFYGGYVDALIDGSNMEISNALTIIRRPGLSVFNTNTIPTPPLIFYDWRRSDTTIAVIADTATASFIVPTANGPLNQIFTKTVSAQGFYQGVGNTLFMGDGTDLFKFDTTTQQSFGWGITPPATAPL